MALNQISSLWILLLKHHNEPIFGMKLALRCVLIKPLRMAISASIERKVALLIYIEKQSSIRLKKTSRCQIAACNRSCWCGLGGIVCKLGSVEQLYRKTCYFSF